MKVLRIEVYFLLCFRLVDLILLVVDLILLVVEGCVVIVDCTLLLGVLFLEWLECCVVDVDMSAIILSMEYSISTLYTFYHGSAPWFHQQKLYSMQL